MASVKEHRLSGFMPGFVVFTVRFAAHTIEFSPKTKGNNAAAMRRIFFILSGIPYLL
jgi:hypothetical protein